MAQIDLPRSSIDIGDLPSNSINGRSEPQRPKFSKVAKGKVVTKKRGAGRMFADAFLGDDIMDVKTYLIQEVLVPTIKNTIVDVVGGGIEMLLLGRSGGRRYVNNSRPGQSYVSYNSCTNNRTGNMSYNRTTNRYGVDDIIFETRGDAEATLDAMFDAIKDYGGIAVAELYDMLDRPCVHTDYNWGWKDLGSASVRRVPNGYLLVLPKAISLK